jgi:probable phosphomutase (TIGR03848 family)
MSIILLVRHGETDYVKKGRLAGRLPGIPLNERGQQQARIVAEKLTGAPIKAIYTSPIERAYQTAEPIAQALGLELVTRPGLIETEIGEWQNEKVRGLSRRKIWKIVQSAPSLFRFPGGESFAEIQQRITSDLLALSSEHEPKDILVCVSHADPIKLAIAYFIGLPLDNFQRIQVSTASINILHMSESACHLAALNINVEQPLTFPKP